MKRLTFLLTMMLFTFGIGNVWAEEYTIGWGSASGTNSTNFTATSGEVSGILSFSCAKNNGTTTPAYNSNNKDLRLYYHNGGNGGSITITPATGITITEAVMTTSTTPSVKYAVDGGTATSVTQSNKVYTISGIAAKQSLKIQNVNTSNTQLRIKTIKITYTTSSAGSGTEETVVSVPTFSVPEGTFYSPINVELSCETADAEIYYTLDGTTPSSTSEKYTTAIAISETTTVKAIAVKDGLTDSEVATATYTKGETVTSYDIDFETNALEAYVNWDFSNITIASTAITAKEGTYYGNTSGKGTNVYIKTKETIQYPGTLTFYTSKESGNTTSSSWLVQVSENGTSWTEVASFDATTGDKGTWTERIADLSDYENVYVQITYTGSTAIRAIDEISLAQGVAPVKYALTITTPENGTLSITKGEDPVTSGEEFKEGTTFNVTATPNSGYTGGTILVKDANDVDVTSTVYSDGILTMPAYAITISATFEVNEAPDATLTLSKNGEEEDITGNKKGDKINLPSTIENDCSKTFVGWDADANCTSEPTYAPGAEYTLAAETQTLYAVYADGENGEAVTIFSETFDGCNSTGGNDDKWSGSIASGTLTLTGWTCANGAAANACAKFGSGSKKGSAETPAITLTGVATLTFRAAAWSGDSKTLNLSATGATLGEASVTLKDAEWTEYTIVVTGATGSVKIKFEAKNASSNRFFLDDVVVSQTSVNYSNYSTTCAAAPQAEVNPAEVAATAAEGNGTVSVTYENVNTENVTVAIFNDEACTEAFTAGWLTAALDGDKNITYTVAATTLYTERKAYIQLTAPEANGTTEPAKVVIPVTQAGKDKVFASLEALLAAITPTTEGVEVTVTLTNEVIVDFHISGTYTNGIYLNVPYQGGTKQIEIYCYNVPTEWEKGGKVSGTITCPWKVYNSTWELCPENWDGLTYTAPATIASIAVTGTATKTIYVDGEAFDPAGLVATATYTDATNEDVTNLVSWTFDPATLTKGTTSVNVTATLNSVSSAAYEVTGLTVNDIPTKTVAEFIAAGGVRCYLEGIVSNIANATYGNFDLTDASGTIFVYGCLNAEGESKQFESLGVKEGDKIKVIAETFTIYDSKNQATNVQYVSHIPAATIEIADITMEVGETKNIAATVTPEGAAVTYTIKENTDNAISFSGNTITALAVGTATITASVAAGADYLANSVDFTVTVTPESVTDQVVILAHLDGQWYAMKGEAVSGVTGQIAALPVEYFNGTLYNVADADKESITWTRSVVDGKTTFVNDNKYLKGGASTNLTLVASADDACQWIWNTAGYYTTNTSGTIRTFIYRNTYNFKNYSVGEAGKEYTDGKNCSDLPVVTAPVFATAIEIGGGDNSEVLNENNGQTVNVIVDRSFVAEDGYYTLCVPFNMSASIVGTAYQISGITQHSTTEVTVNCTSAQTIQAGQPYLIVPSATINGFAVDNVTIANEAKSTATVSGAGVSITMHGVLSQSSTTSGLYWVGNQGYLYKDDVDKLGLRAYFSVTTQSSIPPRMRIVTGENAETGVDNIITTDAPVKVIENGQLIIIRNGEKFNVQGMRL